MRPIDADALVVYLYKATEECIAMEDHVPEQFKEYYRGKMEAFIEVAAHVKRHTPTLDYVPKQQWISVKDRLPEEGENSYLVRLEDGFIGTAVWDGGWELWNDSGEVTHWMCLPEPPKEE